MPSWLRKGVALENFIDLLIAEVRFYVSERLNTGSEGRTNSHETILCDCEF